MKITTTAVFTFQDLKTKERPFAKIYYNVTAFNRINNKTTTIEVPYTLYENIDLFIENCVYSISDIDFHCRVTNQPKTVYLIQERFFYQEQVNKMTEIGLDVNTIFEEIIFGGN